MGLFTVREHEADEIFKSKVRQSWDSKLFLCIFYIFWFLDSVTIII